MIHFYFRDSAHHRSDLLVLNRVITLTRNDDHLESSDTLVTWQSRHPKNWTGSDIVSWLYWLSLKLKPEEQTVINGEAFNTLSGSDMYKMTMADFMTKDPVNGQRFYNEFQQLINKGKVTV